jgi:type I restriction enzyme S subunit
MHNLNSIFEGGGYKHEGIKHYEGEYKPHHVARAGDLIVANTEQGHDRLLIGYAAVVPARFDSESLFSHHIYRVRPKRSSALTPDYLCHLLNTSVIHDTVSGYANGTTVNMLPIDALQRPHVVVPPPGIVRAFDGFARAARVRHEEMIDESRTLAALREALLPKLISGELRVGNAERFVETA